MPNIMKKNITEENSIKSMDNLRIEINNVIMINLNLFSLLLLLSFTFIIYYSYQKSIYYSEMTAKIN